MKKIMFVCHGNICRSPMAEFLFRKMLYERELDSRYEVASSATSSEEEGNPPYPPVKRILEREGISVKGKIATPLSRSDYGKYDMFIGMDSYNVRNMLRIFGDDPEGKITKLLDFTEEKGDVSDPYYSGGFERTFLDIKRGLVSLLDFLEKRENGR